MQDLIALQKELLTYLGYDSSKFYINTYKQIAEEFGSKRIRK